MIKRLLGWVWPKTDPSTLYVIIEDWRRHYNEVRPHSYLNYRTPAQFVAGIEKDLSTEANVLS